MRKRDKVRALLVSLMVVSVGIEPTHVTHLLQLGAVATGGLFLIGGRFIIKLLNSVSRAFAGMDLEEKED
ncbi:hypothetical protein H0W91_04015 [Patescibacteria group bacterium]|nr:hypothetical protein [Patescibacteria group bacterium]